MKQVDKKVFSIIVTSPPYDPPHRPDGLQSNHENGSRREAYIKWLGEIAEASKNVLKDSGSFFLNVGGKPSDPWFAWDVAREFGKFFELQNVIHWIKHISIPRDAQARSSNLNGDVSFGHFRPINSDTYLNYCQEYIFHFTKSGEVPIHKLAIGVPYQHKSNVKRWKAKGRDLRDRGNVWFIRHQEKHGAYQKVLHPFEFPEKLPYLCIKLHGVTKDTVCYDPFMGIGNTALACVALGVHYVGTEINPKYVKIARRLIARKTKSLRVSDGKKQGG